MQPENTDEYLDIGIISRLANGGVARWVGIATVVAMAVPVVFWLVRL